IKPVLLVPHAVRTEPVHGAGDQQELDRIVLRQLVVGRIVRRKLDGDLQHVLAKQRDPRGPVGLLQIAAGRQWRTTVENANVVETEEDPFEQVSAKAVLAIYPPAEIRGQPAENPFQEIEVVPAAQRLLNAVEEDRRPSLHRRVDVAEIPLIGRDLSGWMQVSLAEQQIELLLCEIDIYRRQGERMKG